MSYADKFMEFTLRYLTTLIILVLIPSTFAGPIQVVIDDKSYEVNLTKDFLTFSEQGFSKKIIKQKCNSAFIDQFGADLKANQIFLAEMKKADISNGAVKISFDGKTKFAFRFGSEGKFFSDLPLKVKNIWLTSERVCAR